MLSSTLLFLSGQDTIVILIVALVLFGGKKLPELAKGLGQGIREFKDASEGVKRDIQEQINKETSKNEAPVPPPVVSSTLVADHSAPVVNTSVAHDQTTLVPDHSAPVATTPAARDQTVLVSDHSAPVNETPKTDHPRETPLP